MLRRRVCCRFAQETLALDKDDPKKADSIAATRKKTNDVRARARTSATSVNAGSPVHFPANTTLLPHMALSGLPSTAATGSSPPARPTGEPSVLQYAPMRQGVPRSPCLRHSQLILP